MKDLNILICEGNTPEEGKVFQDVGIPTHTESLKESLAYYNQNLKIDVLNPCLELHLDEIVPNLKKYDGLIWGGSSLNIYNRPDLDVYFNELYDEIKSCSHMTYHGTVSNDEIREALKKAHIFAYPSTFMETSCMALMEAMSAGCICVHSSYGSLPETANRHTMMYEYTPNKFDHCGRFAETLIQAVKLYNSDALLANAPFGKEIANNSIKNLFNITCLVK